MKEELFNGRTGTVLIDGQKYDVDLFVPFGLLEKIEREQARQNRVNYRYFVSQIIQQQILNNTDSLPSVDRISEQSDSFFEDYFNLVFCREAGVGQYYLANVDISEPCERYIISIFDFFRGMVRESLKKTIGYLPTANHLDSVSSVLSKAVGRSLEAIAEKLIFFKSLYFPKGPDERTKELLDAHQKWGDLGWTHPPSAPHELFYKFPSNSKEASKKVLVYCSDNDMEDLFSLIRKFTIVKKSDFEEAVFDFRQRQYKSSVLILFSLIDAILIRSQRDEDRYKRDNKRPSGWPAGRNLFGHIKEERNISNTTFLYFDFQNIFSCLMRVFADGEDFVNQPPVINRNFVDHGMIHRKITRKDCVQVFLLYYNFLDFLNSFGD